MRSYIFTGVLYESLLRVTTSEQGIDLNSLLNIFNKEMMMAEFTEQQIQANKTRFLDLVNGITREGVDKERLIAQLTTSDFFDAPASAIYHNACRGGLCAHCLNVYDWLTKLVADAAAMTSQEPYSEDTIRIVALFHDFDKMNKYERSFRNVKVYSPTGSKFDEMGKFDWQSVPSYKRKEDSQVFSIGTHGANSVYMTETFVPLSTEEHCAILNHSSVYDNPKLNTTGIYSKYHLACLLHLADMAATYVSESQ